VDDLNALVEPNVGAVVIALAVACLVLAILAILLVRRTSRLDRRLRGLTRGAEGQSLEAILDAHLDKVYAVARDLDEHSARTAVLESTLRRSFQRVGLVRFNPYEDTGGNQSFALAVLDAQGSGFVISSLHARSGTRVYGKSVSAGASESNLSAEEMEALRIAISSGAHPGKGG
jgi:Protein of unknown function (DUF4446)